MVYKVECLANISLPDMTVTPVSFPPRIRISAILPSDGEEVILGSTFHGLWKYNPSNGETSPFGKEYNSPLCCLLEAEGRICGGQEERSECFRSGWAVPWTAEGLRNA